ncbi:MAG TPA: LytTR family DNA-binding domain-containing protein [Puia sp.]|nr:LytTR family DNA-binding domain-containing protein [Puia sp.]
MENQANAYSSNNIEYPIPSPLHNSDFFDKNEDFKTLLRQFRPDFLDSLLHTLTPPADKKSFLVYKNHKYLNVLTKNIALFYVKYESSVILSFDNQESFVNQSLDQIQSLVSEKQFFRLNRQYLISFNLIKEVEHYFARKLLVTPAIPIKEKLLVPREKVSEFLRWLDNR